MITNYTDYCIFCGKRKDDDHHLVFGIANRKLSDEDDLIVPVCRECHEFLHKHDKVSRIIGQLAYEKQKCADGFTEEAARESFRIRYGKSYL